MDLNSLLSGVMGNSSTEDGGRQYDPIGDGTEGKTTDEIMGLLRAAREIMQRPKKNIAHSFNPGDLVWASRYGEHGIVLGEMPIDTKDGLVEQWSHRSTHPYRRATTTYIVLTLTKKAEDEPLSFRIRYANSGFLKLIEECVVGENNSAWNSLKEYCTNQCIQDCTSECALYKYKHTV